MTDAVNITFSSIQLILLSVIDNAASQVIWKKILVKIVEELRKPAMPNSRRFPLGFWLTIALALIHGSSSAYDSQSNGNRDDFQEHLFEMSMDRNIQPCEDFYGYACGNWRSQSEANYQETLTKLDYEIKLEMEQILPNLHRRNDSQKKFVREVYNYYKSCIDTPAPTTVDYMKWLETHERTLQWPLSATRISGRHSEIDYDWIRMLAILRKYGFNDVILHEMAVPKEIYPKILTIEMGRPIMSNTHINTLRYDVVTGTLRFFMPESEYHSLWSDIQNMDDKLLELKTKHEPDEEVLFATVSSLNEVPWLLEYLRILLDVDNLDPSMELVITNISYLKAVAEFLQGFEAKFICEYIQVKFLSYLNYKQFKNEYRDCVTSTRLLLPLPTQWLYERQHPGFDMEANSLGHIFTKLKQSFLRTLHQNVYNLDKSMMKFFNAKLRTLQLRIGYLAPHSLDELYRNLTLTPTDYYGNRLKIYNYHFKVTHRNLNVRLGRNALEFLPLEHTDTANGLLPYLLPRQRAVMVPLSILQFPVYRSYLPDAYTYSTIGYLMARQIMWEFAISDIDVSAYGQVFSYIMDMLMENPQFREDFDHIATYHRGETEEVDSAIIGLKLAYQVFKEDPRNEPMSRSFFLNFAQMYCGTEDANFHRPAFATNNRKIVNLAVNHMAGFSRTFGCDRGPVHGILYWSRNDDV